jgi:pyruvate/2-oxoglutarate dehydrogenase complex dihydrolipoamide acyltransferase (E2) component
VESDKVDADVESPGTGTLAEIVVPAGETAEVGAVIARIS